MLRITEQLFHIIGDAVYQSFFTVPLNIDAFADRGTEVELSC